MGSSTNKKRVIMEELVQGQEFAAQLQILFQKHSEKGGRFSDSGSSAEELVQKILTSFNDTLSMLMITSVGSASVSQNHHQGAATTCNDNIDSPCCDDDQRSQDWSQSRKRAASKDKRGSYKRKKDVQTSTVVSSTVEDGHAWRKYGQKEILNSIHPRSYFRCTRKYEQGCKAMKQVQRMEDDSQMYQITYIGTHTCSKANPQIITFAGSESWEPYDFMVTTSSGDSKIPSKQQYHGDFNDPITTPTVKQEIKEEKTTAVTTTTTSSDVTAEILDPIMWKDIIGGDGNGMESDYGYTCSEITSQNLELDFVIKTVEFENYFTKFLL